MCFFNYYKYITKIQQNILNRKKKKKNIYGFIKFSVGDIINVTYISKYIIYGFEGICISKKKKNITLPNTNIILRNVLLGVGVELSLSYFYVRIYNLHLSDYKRKRFSYKRAKLYFVRNRLNKFSGVK